jgi:F-type H+-transporting ATPase subunit b
MKLDWWTLGLQAINVIVLLWVLQRFLFRPVQAIIARRQQATQQLMADAKAAMERADREQAALDAAHRELVEGREKALAAAQSDAHKARDALLAQATADAQQQRAAAEAALQRERAEVAHDLRVTAAALAGDMARRLLERLPATSWSHLFVEDACGKLASLKTAESAMLRGSEGHEPVQVSSADPLDEEDRDAIRAALVRALGHDVPVAFSIDSRLIAGVELRFRQLVIRNHWAADLQRLREQLQHDDDPARPA